MISSLMDTWILVAVEPKRNASAIAGSTCSSRAACRTRTTCARFDIGDRGVELIHVGTRSAAKPSGRATPRASRGKHERDVRAAACTSPARRRRRCAHSPTCARSATSISQGRYSIEVIDLVENPALGPRRPDPGVAHAGAATADADQEDHRRPVQHRTRARGARPASTPAQHVNEPHSCPGQICEPQTFVLRLYVTGMTPRSTRAITAVRAVCEEFLAGRYDLEIIDVYQQPALSQRRADRRHADARSRKARRRSGASSVTCRIARGCWPGSGLPAEMPA